MQPTLCSRCKKNVAVIFITRIENGESHNEGLCLRCARELHIKPVDEMMEKLGISDADLDNLTGDVAEMLGSMGMLGGDGAPDTDADASDADTDEDDGKTATYGFEMLNELEHAWVMTVHKSQGSEYRAVILSAFSGSQLLLTRSVLYTAITRARELFIIVGNEEIIAAMTRNDRRQRRYSGLKLRLEQGEAE